jgi:hypothetical protein
MQTLVFKMRSKVKHRKEDYKIINKIYKLNKTKSPLPKSQQQSISLIQDKSKNSAKIILISNKSINNNKN